FFSASGAAVRGHGLRLDIPFVTSWPCHGRGQRVPSTCCAVGLCGAAKMAPSPGATDSLEAIWRFGSPIATRTGNPLVNGEYVSPLTSRTAVLQTEAPITTYPFHRHFLPSLLTPAQLVKRKGAVTPVLSGGPILKCFV